MITPFEEGQCKALILQRWSKAPICLIENSRRLNDSFSYPQTVDHPRSPFCQSHFRFIDGNVVATMDDRAPGESRDSATWEFVLIFPDDRHDLDASADSLASEAELEVNTCDQAFGMRP